MRRNRPYARIYGGGLVALLLTAGALSAQSTLQVRVKDPAAVIRMAPETGAPVILDSLTAGTVFTVQRRMGDWFEIKFIAPSGVQLTGYIHRFQVEEVLSDPAAARGESANEAGAAFVSPLRSGLEFGLTGGMGFNRFTGSRYEYAKVWEPAFDLLNANETGYISLALGNPINLAASCAYFFTPGLGLRLQFEGRLMQSQTEGFSNYGVGWTMNGADADSAMMSWPVTGSLSVTPISLNGIARVALGSVVTAFLTAGPTVFSGTFSADSKIGYGRSWIETPQNFDFFTLPVKLEKTIRGIGFNAGAGLEIWAARSVAILVEGEYYSGPSATASWAIQPGPYASNIAAGITWSNPALAGALADYIAPVTVNLSFVKIVAGIKIHL